MNERLSGGQGRIDDLRPRITRQFHVASEVEAPQRWRGARRSRRRSLSFDPAVACSESVCDRVTARANRNNSVQHLAAMMTQLFVWYKTIFWEEQEPLQNKATTARKRLVASGASPARSVLAFCAVSDVIAKRMSISLLRTGQHQVFVPISKLCDGATLDLPSSRSQNPLMLWQQYISSEHTACCRSTSSELLYRIFV